MSKSSTTTKGVATPNRVTTYPGERAHRRETRKNIMGRTLDTVIGTLPKARRDRINMRYSILKNEVESRQMPGEAVDRALRIPERAGRGRPPMKGNEMPEGKPKRR
jgi:hypothetical protein